MTEKDIEKQVERWDLFARLVPTVYLIVAGCFLLFGIIDFKTVFWVGVAGFAFTAVSWWFWTIFTIRKLVYTLHRATADLGEVRNEFQDINKEIEKLRNNEK